MAEHNCKLKVYETTGEIRAIVVGNFTSVKTQNFIDQLRKLSKKSNVTIDFTETDVIDSYGIGALMFIRNYFNSPVRVLIKKDSLVAQALGIACIGMIFNVVEEE